MPAAASVSSRSGVAHSSSVSSSKRRAQQHELAIARDDEIEHGVVAVTGHETLAHDEAQVLGERRVGIVDRLVLADEAAQLGRQAAGARLERGVLQHLVGLDGEAPPHGSRQHASRSTAASLTDVAHRHGLLRRRAGAGAARRAPRGADPEPPVAQREQAAASP